MSDSFKVLQRIRKIALDDALRELAVLVASESFAEKTLSAHMKQIADEQERISSAGDEDTTVEAFARWLDNARERYNFLLDVYERAVAQTIRARGAVDVAKISYESITNFISKKVALQVVERNRAEQRRLEELIPSKSDRFE